MPSFFAQRLAVAGAREAMARIGEKVAVQPPTLDGILSVRGVINLEDADADEEARAAIEDGTPVVIEHPIRNTDRTAGATEVLVSSAQRWAQIHELRGAPEPSLGELLARLSPVDLVIVEGALKDAGVL